jgi:type II secretory pathway pseudopilin PulG
MVVVLVIGILIAIALPMFIGAKTRAEERSTEAQLRTGLTAGLTYWSDGGTFTGFDVGCSGVPDDCSAADSGESSVVWIGPDAPAARQVSIVFASGNNLLLVARSTAGDFFCVAQSTGQSDRGRGVAFADVDTPPECAGGW